MTEAGLSRLAVAQLTQAGGPAAAFRPAQERPLQAYCLLTGAETQCRIQVYLQQGNGEQVMLEGDLVWLAAPVMAGATTTDESGHLDEHLPAEREVPRVCDPAEGPDYDVHRHVPPDPFCVPPAFPVPDPFAQTEPHVDLFKWIPQPAIEVIARPAPETGQAGPAQAVQEPTAQAGQGPAKAEPAPTGQPPATLSVPLTWRHPLAPRAGGTALLNFREGKVHLTLRGLPTPAALGRDPSTDRPFATYRAYLVNQRAGARHSLGLLTRAWGENFRLESEGDLPLARFDTVLVTVDDRTLPQAPGSAPQVLAGSYNPHE